MIAALLLQTSGTPGILGSPLVMMVIVMGIFYVMLILPQQRQRKKTQAMLAALKNGDKVVTTSGIYGTVNGIDGDTVILKIADQVKDSHFAFGDCHRWRRKKMPVNRPSRKPSERSTSAAAMMTASSATVKRSTPISAEIQPSFSIMNPNLKWKALFILAVILALHLWADWSADIPDLARAAEGQFQPADQARSWTCRAARTWCCKYRCRKPSRRKPIRWWIG